MCAYIYRIYAYIYVACMFAYIYRIHAYIYVACLHIYRIHVYIYVYPADPACPFSLPATTALACPTSNRSLCPTALCVEPLSLSAYTFQTCRNVRSTFYTTRTRTKLELNLYATN